MNIRSRIVARKIVFCYFFEQYSLALYGQKTSLLEDIDKMVWYLHDDDGIKDVSSVMTKEYYAHVDTEIAYIITRFFEHQWADDPKTVDPDRAYIESMAPCFWNYEAKVRELINKYAVSFTFDEMDILDRVIFVLGYAEFIEMKTPKEVMINEMVEFGKRYGDESSSKLINGIAHKIFTPGEEIEPEMSPLDRVFGKEK